MPIFTLYFSSVMCLSCNLLNLWNDLWNFSLLAQLNNDLFLRLIYKLDWMGFNDIFYRFNEWWRLLEGMVHLSNLIFQSLNLLKLYLSQFQPQNQKHFHNFYFPNLSNKSMNHKLYLKFLSINLIYLYLKT